MLTNYEVSSSYHCCALLICSRGRCYIHMKLLIYDRTRTLGVLERKRKSEVKVKDTGLQVASLQLEHLSRYLNVVAQKSLGYHLHPIIRPPFPRDKIAKMEYRKIGCIKRSSSSTLRCCSLETVFASRFDGYLCHTTCWIFSFLLLTPRFSNITDN